MVEEYDGAFEGGATLIPGFLGALAYMEARNRWFKRVAGTSSGAITAALVASGYRAASPRKGSRLETLREITYGTKFSDLLLTPISFTKEEVKNSLLYQAISTGMAEATFGLSGVLPSDFLAKLLHAAIQGAAKVQAQVPLVRHFPNLMNLVERGGMYDGEFFKDWMNKKIVAGLQSIPGSGTVSARPTFKELYARTGISLTITAADVGGETQNLLIFNELCNAEVPVADAVRMSMSIPGLFTPVAHQGCMVVDGGILANYPLFVFASEKSSFVPKTPPDGVDRRNIGFLLYERPVPETGKACPKCTVAPLTRATRLAKVLQTLNSAFNPMKLLPQLNETYTKDTVPIDTTGFGWLDFNMSKERKKELATRGWIATKNFFPADKTRSPLNPDQYLNL